MKDIILNMAIKDALFCFDVHFDRMDDPESERDDYYVEFGRWVEEMINQERNRNK